MGILLGVLLGLLKFILFIFLFLIAILLILLILPWRYEVRFSYFKEFIGKVRFGWPWGIISYEMDFPKGSETLISLGGHPIKRMKVKEKDPLKKKEKTKDNENEPSTETTKEKLLDSDRLHFMKELIEEHLLEYTFLFMRNVLRILLPKHCRIHVTYGTEDPSLTGCILAAYMSYPELQDRWNIYLDPDFAEEVFEGEIELYGKGSLMGIVIEIIKLLFKRPVRRLIKEIRRRKKDGKKKLEQRKSGRSI